MRPHRPVLAHGRLLPPAQGLPVDLHSQDVDGADEVALDEFEPAELGAALSEEAELLSGRSFEMAHLFEVLHEVNQRKSAADCVGDITNIICGETSLYIASL